MSKETKHILSDEFEIFHPFNSEKQKCLICDELVVSPSMGGDFICPSCDCGCDKKGNKWDYYTFYKLTGPNSKAVKRIKEIKALALRSNLQVGLV